jgi:hypothetical protein
MLRVRFRKQKDAPIWEQYVAAAGPGSFLLMMHEFVDRSIMQRVVDERQASIDPINGPVFAADVFQGSDEPQTLLTSAHYLAIDLVSWRVVWHELSRHPSTGTTSLPAPNLSFRAWCCLQLEGAKDLDPAAVFSFEVTPANFEYWGKCSLEILS